MITKDDINFDGDMEGRILIDGTFEIPETFFNTDFYIPRGYEVKDRCVKEIRLDENDNPVLNAVGIPIGYQICDSACMITGRSLGLDDNERYLKVTFHDGRNWLHYWIKQKEIFTKKGIFEHLVSQGFVTDEKDAARVTKYFRKCYTVNDASNTLVQGIVASSNGWKHDNTCFVFGTRMICESGVDKEVFLTDSSLEEKLSAKGTVEEWVAGNKRLLAFPKPRFVCYAAMTAPLLEPLNVSSFLVDSTGGSSTGKTTEDDAAISQIGNPKALKHKGESTVASVEENAKMFSGLPLYYDETTNTSEKTAQNIIYTIANETEKGRARKDGGLRETKSWKCVGLTTGEKSLINYAGNTGQYARVITLKGGIGQSGIKDIVDESKATNVNNYGHIIEPFLRKVFKHKAELNVWFREYKSQFEVMDNDINNRLIDYFAAIAVAGKLLEEVYQEIGIEPVNHLEIVNQIYEEVVLNNPIKDQAIVALERVYDWMSSHSGHFINEMSIADIRTWVTVSDKAPDIVYGWYGNPKGIMHIDFNKSELDKFLEREGFNPSYVIDYWKNYGILTVGSIKDRKTGQPKDDPSGARNVSHYIKNQSKKTPQRVISIQEEKFKQVLELTDSDIIERIGRKSVW
ncbi:DUF927 domain-containing protein [Methanolobus sediminis]|uniref:DUF927 domain-containing protein n=1 Tax=Methanolobus sediminis TaxID=3072978 RepID=A0AA51UJE8_9EURY|nr:DUF927 domain-containing protein [Methanolobus sediminis]WMW24698.1 DUF927 domain-containing protein [Methanolobus sediminis]